MNAASRIVLRPLTSELYASYLDCFDHRAFTDGNPNGPCYCTSANQDAQAVQQMVSEFPMSGVQATLRSHAVRLLHEGRVHGYLALDGDTSVGWCNAAAMESYARNPDFIPDFAREHSCGKTVSIVCFEIAPGYRGMGIASAMIARVCADAQSDGYTAVEGYPRVREGREAFDFHGPVELYRKAGFVEVARQDERIVLRKMLRDPSVQA